MHPALLAFALLFVANGFMTYAWYGHLGSTDTRPMWLAILTSWGIASLEYCFQVPANRIGSTVLSLGQLKISQEVISMLVFMAFSAFYMKKPITMDMVYATGCLGLAAYFVFRRA